MPLINTPRLFFLEEPLQPDPPSVPSSTYAIPILQDSPDNLPVTPPSVSPSLVKFWSPLTTVLSKPRLLSPKKGFRMKYMTPIGINILCTPYQSPLGLRLIVPWPIFHI